MAEIQRDILLSADQRGFAIVLVEIGGIARPVVGPSLLVEFMHYVANPRIRLKVHLAVKPHADFGGIVTAEHGTVLYECDFRSEPCGRQCGGGSGDASSDDNQVKLTGVRRRLGPPQQLPPPRSHTLQIVGRSELRVRGKHNRIASPLEAGEIVQCDGGLGLGDIDRPAGLPMPLRPFGPERGLERLAVNEQLKLARRPGRFPTGDPVARANPNPIGSGGGKCHGSRSILNRYAEPVSKHKRRAHLVHELLIDNPPAAIVKRLSLDQNGMLGTSGDNTERQYR